MKLFDPKGTLDANRTFAAFAQCTTFACDPAVPVWLSVQTTADGRYAPGTVGFWRANRQ